MNKGLLAFLLLAVGLGAYVVISGKQTIVGNAGYPPAGRR